MIPLQLKQIHSLVHVSDSILQYGSELRVTHNTTTHSRHLIESCNSDSSPCLACDNAAITLPSPSANVTYRSYSLLLIGNPHSSSLPLRFRRPNSINHMIHNDFLAPITPCHTIPTTTTLRFSLLSTKSPKSTTYWSSSTISSLFLVDERADIRRELS